MMTRQKINLRYKDRDLKTNKQTNKLAQRFPFRVEGVFWVCMKISRSIRDSSEMTV